MDWYVKSIKMVASFMNSIAAVALTFIIALTTLDVILRIFNRPIVGTFELVAFMGAVIFGFAIPATSWNRSHIFVDFVVQSFPKETQGVVNVCTRVAAIGLFSIAGYNLYKHGLYLYRTQEVSPTLQLPFYLAVVGLGTACTVECLVFIADIVRIWRGQYE